MVSLSPACLHETLSQKTLSREKSWTVIFPVLVFFSLKGLCYLPPNLIPEKAFMLVGTQENYLPDAGGWSLGVLPDPVAPLAELGSLTSASS